MDIPRNTLSSVFDARFQTMITPVIVRWIYLACIAGIGILTLFFFLLAWSLTTWRNGALIGVLGMVAAPIVGFTLILITRVACEFVLTRFRRS